MIVYLIRHAAAEDRDPRRWPDDGLRPLTRDGRRQFRRLARHLRRTRGRIDVLLSSGLVRAMETAAVLHEEGWPSPRRCAAMEEQPPKAVIPVLLEHAAAEAIALVGHEPSIGQMASLLLTGDIDGLRLDFRKGAALCLAFDRRPAAGGAVLHWLLPPQLLLKAQEK